MHLHIIERSVAREHGLKRYFHGWPCKNGMVAERLTSTALCCCVTCRASRAEKSRPSGRQYYQENKDSRKTKTKEWFDANKDHRREYDRKKYQENKVKRMAQMAEYRANNRHIGRKHEQSRRAAEKRAIPSWYGELDDFVLSEASQLCLMRKESTGFDWHIDHMIPLKSETVCGLHVWNNFQVIPAYMNLAKNNRLIFVQPYEWVSSIC